MEISGSSGRWDCNGWKRFNRAWNIFRYLLQVFLLIPGGMR